MRTLHVEGDHAVHRVGGVDSAARDDTLRLIWQRDEHAVEPCDPRLQIVCAWLARRFGGPRTLGVFVGVDGADLEAACGGRPHCIPFQLQLRLCSLTLSSAGWPIPWGW